MLGMFLKNEKYFLDFDEGWYIKLIFQSNN